MVGSFPFPGDVECVSSVSETWSLPMAGGSTVTGSDAPAVAPAARGGLAPPEPRANSGRSLHAVSVSVEAEAD